MARSDLNSSGLKIVTNGVIHSSENFINALRIDIPSLRLAERTVVNFTM